MTDKELTVLRPNPKIKPSFAEGTVMLLKKNYTSEDSINSDYLTEGVCCVTRECGLSKYPTKTEEEIQTGEWNSFTDKVEWCTVDIIMEGLDPDSDEGCVRAEDLQPYIFL